MRYEDVEIIIGTVDGQVRPLGWVEAADTRYSMHAKEPSTEVVNERLREQAIALGANAVVDVTYVRKGWSLTTMGSLRARGQAVVLDQADEEEWCCTACGADVDEADQFCRTCGGSLEVQGSPPTSPTGQPAPPATKVCPHCAEEVKAAALVCRFCRYGFGPLPPPGSAAS